MLNLLKDESNRSYMLTENGAVTFASSGSFALDFFAAAGALREADEAEIIVRFTRAFAEHPTYALRTLFYARDVRGGLGERRLFRMLLRHLAAYAPAALVKNLPLVPEFGRWDDLLALLGTPAEKGVLRLVHEQLASDLRADEEGAMVSLLAKWLPSVNTSSRAARAQARSLAKLLGMREAEYRRTLVRLRRRIALIENALHSMLHGVCCPTIRTARMHSSCSTALARCTTGASRCRAALRFRSPSTLPSAIQARFRDISSPFLGPAACRDQGCRHCGKGSLLQDVLRSGKHEPCGGL